MTRSHSKPVFDTSSVGLAVVAILLFSFVPLLGAQFGYGNQIEQFSIIARMQDPTFAAGDFYVDSAAGFGPRFYYAEFLAALNHFIALPLLINGLSVLTNFALGLVTYLAASRFFQANTIGATTAALVAIANPGFSLGLAGYLRFDSFQPANIAICLALFGVYALVRGRVLWAALLFVGAAAMHPLHGVEIALIAYVSYGVGLLVRPPAVGFVRPLGIAIGSSILFAIAIAGLWIYPSLGTPVAHLLANEFFDILVRFRAPHHYLGMGFPVRSWGVAGLFLIAMLGLYVWYVRQNRMDRESFTLITATFLVVVMCLGSLVLVDTLHNRAAATAQIFRMLLLVKWTGFLLLGWWAGQLLNRHGWLGVGLILPLVVVSGDAHPIGVVLVIGAVLTTYLVKNVFADRTAPILTWIGVALMLVIAAMLTARFGNSEMTVRAGVGYLLLVLVFCVPLKPALRVGGAAAVLALVLFSTVINRDTGLFGLKSLRAQYTWSDLKADQYNVARAAGSQSAAGAIWLVPPGMESFRVLAGRGVVVDYTSIPFEDMAMRERYHRMDSLFGPIRGGGFHALAGMNATYRKGVDLRRAQDEFGATHAVLFVETPWDGPILYANDTYKAVPLYGG